MKMQPAGIAIIKLKDIAAALSVKPTFFTWEIKNLLTSNKGMPLKPGIKIFLLLRIAKVTGASVISFRSIFFKAITGFAVS